MTGRDSSPEPLVGRIHSLETFGTLDGPGLRFVAFLQGCPMKCAFCHNPDTRDGGAAVKYTLSARELLDKVLRYRNYYVNGGGVTLSGGEPLVQARFSAEFFRLCRAEGLHTALDTSGALTGNAVEELLDMTDLVILDIKTEDAELAPSYTGNTLEANHRFGRMVQSRGIPMWIRHVVVPGITEDQMRLRKVAESIASMKGVERVELLPYHTMGVYKWAEMGLDYPLAGTPVPGEDTMRSARGIFREVLGGIPVL